MILVYSYPTGCPDACRCRLQICTIWHCLGGTPTRANVFGRNHHSCGLLRSHGIHRYTVYNMKYPNMCIYICIYIYTEMDNCEATRQILASPRSQWWKANLDKYFLVNIIHT